MKSGNVQKSQRVAKLETFNDFLDEKIEKALLELSKRKLSAKEAERTVLLVRISNVIEQLGDSGDKLSCFMIDLADSGISLSPESMAELEQIYRKFRDNMLIARESIPKISEKNIKLMRKNDIAFRELINASYKRHLERLHSQKTYAGTSFVEAVSIFEDASSHVREIRKLSELYRKVG